LMKTKPRSHSPSRVASAALLAHVLTAPFALAQEAPPPPSPPPIPAPAAPAPQTGSGESTEDVELVRLDPFTVSADRDVGYTAVESLAGGRTNTPVRLTPAAMSSLTRTFIEDVSLLDVRDALQWSLNVVPSDWTAGKRTPFNSFDFNFRGAGQSLQGGAGPTRNYYTFYQSADTYNMDRIEFDRGPTSILFGVGTVGGVLSSYTKVPRFADNFVTPTVVVDSEGSYRFEGDANFFVAENLALRLNVLDEHTQG